MSAPRAPRRLRPEHQVYLLVHIVLVVAGLLIAQLGGVTGIAIGTSVAATGVCGWVIFFWVRLTEQITAGNQRIRQVGIVDAFPARSVPIRPQYEHRFRQARQQIDFLGFGLRALREDFGGEFDDWLVRVNVRVLLVDPERPLAAWTYTRQRDTEEGNSPGSIAADVSAFLSYLAPVKQRHPSRLHVRLYSCLPSINVCRVDDEIFWGPYVLGAQSRNTPTFLVNRFGVMFDVLSKHYEQMWSDGRYSRGAFSQSGTGYRSVLDP